MWLWLILSPPCHPQQDRRRGNHRFCTLCMFNMCLLFCDNKKMGRGWANRVFSLSFFSPPSVYKWTKVGGIWRHKREEIQETVKRPAIKHSAGNYLPVIRPSCSEYQRDSNSPNKLWKGWICALSNVRGLQRGSHLWSPLPPSWRCWWWWRRFTSLYISAKVIHWRVMQLGGLHNSDSWMRVAMNMKWAR